MDIQRKTATLTINTLAIVLLVIGCGEPRGTKRLAPTIELGSTVGSLAEVFAFNPIAVEGYALVGGLNGTGSAECPPRVMEYLEKYILKQMPEQQDVEKFISSRDTAVVVVRGIIPAEASKNQYFDVGVSSPAGTQTISLEGGWLYGADLYEAGRLGIGARPLAVVEGPVFIDTIDTTETNSSPEGVHRTATGKRAGYVLAGGVVLDDYKISLGLRQPDYRAANAIRNRLNERFGPDTAKAVSAGKIELKVPAEYGEQKRRFVSIVKSTYLTQDPQTTEERIRTFVIRLATGENKWQSEIALEAIGNKNIGKLGALLNSFDEEVRLRAARCMLNSGSERGLDTLRQIALGRDSLYRFEAIEAITAGASGSDATSVLRRLLRDDDFDIRLAAYEGLRKLDDIVITRRLVGGNFYLEQIVQAEHPAIYVSRSGQPRIVLFAAPLYCRDNIFVQSADGNITINAPAGQRYVSIMRKHPKRPSVVVQLRSSFELSNIIQTLCEEPIKRAERGRRGLNVSYAEGIGLLKQMCEKGAVQAEFHTGELPKTDLIVKK